MSTMAMLAGSRGPYTRADLELLPDDGHRYEIIDGILIVSATHMRRARFERAGIPSYWAVEPVARPAEASLVADLDEDGGYRQVAKVVGDERLEATRPYPVTVVAADLVV